MRLTYEKVADYHVALRKGDPPVVKVRGKSRCAASLDLTKAQALLDGGHRHGSSPDGGSGYPQHVFAKHDGVWYKAHAHREGHYHGFPVPERQVAPEILKRTR